MSDVGPNDSSLLEALLAAQGGQNPRGTTPIGPPQGIPGQFPGILDRIGPGQGQGAPAGASGAGQGAPSPGLLQRLNPFTEYNYQRYLANKARGEGTATQGAPMSAPPPSPAPPQTASLPPMPTNPNNPDPRISAMQMVQPPQQPLAPPAPPMPPPQAAPAQPQQMPAIPPASPQARVAAAQGQQGQQGNPLDSYIKQLMAMQRQQMMLRMAGGLLGAPSLGMGLGRAFTGAADALGSQTPLVNQIAGAQLAYSMTKQGGGSEQEARNNAQLAMLSGNKSLEEAAHPKYSEYKGHGFYYDPLRGSRDDRGWRPWVFDQMAQDPEKSTPSPIDMNDPRVHVKNYNGRPAIRLPDGRVVDPTAEDEDSATLGRWK